MNFHGLINKANSKTHPVVAKTIQREESASWNNFEICTHHAMQIRGWPRSRECTWRVVMELIRTPRPLKEHQRVGAGHRYLHSHPLTSVLNSNADAAVGNEQKARSERVSLFQRRRERATRSEMAERAYLNHFYAARGSGWKTKKTMESRVKQ